MMESSSSLDIRKRKADQLSDDLDAPFTVSGFCDDEVIFMFDDERKLYVSRNMLCYASPVFRAMFSDNFKEKTSGVVKMKEKDYEGLLELLLCLHPGIQKPVTVDNFAVILPLADKYLVNRCTAICRQLLKQILHTEFQRITNQPRDSEYNRITGVIACFEVLNKALLYNYEDVTESAVGFISKFGSAVYLRDDIQLHINNTYISAVAGESNIWSSREEEVMTKRKECRDMFSNLPEKIKIKLLSKRIDKMEDNEIKV